MATLAAVVAKSAGRWLPTTGVPGTDVLAIAPITRRRSCAAATTAPAPSALPAVAGAGAAARALLLTARLASGLPVFFTEHQTPHAIHDLLRLAAFLEHSQSADDVLDRDRVQIEEHLEGDGGLGQAFRDHLQELLYHLGVRDVVAEGAEVHGERRDADAELGDGLALLEDERAELAAKLLGAGVTRAAVADSEHLDGVPRLLHGPLATERPPHLRGDRAQESRHGLAVLMVLIFIRVFVDADVDGVPDAERLEVHLHHQRPLRVVRPREHRPRDVRGWSLDDALHDS
ncbi:uncharacterized protein [Miscanthus floridulus]|uniref:uncharacterized protein n=1 Tax=Miscanthus floridulus TaxID=154761 RepID=UPI003458426C